MNTTLAQLSLLMFLLLSLEAMAAPTDGTSPQDVITRLVANASKNPLGPVENDVTDQTLNTCNALAKSSMAKAINDTDSPREMIAAEYNQFTLEGPLMSLYSEGRAALFYGKVKLTDDGLANCKDQETDSDTLIVNGKPVSTSHGSSPGFGDGGGFSMFIGSKVRSDGHVIATFCLVQQQGLWKVHGVYFSNDIIQGDDKDFIVRQLSAFAKKS